MGPLRRSPRVLSCRFEAQLLHRRHHLAQARERFGDVIVGGGEREPQETLGDLTEVATWPDRHVGTLQQIERQRQRVDTEVTDRGLTTLLIEAKDTPGGQPNFLYADKRIVDIPGFPDGITGAEISERTYRQAADALVQFRFEEELREIQHTD